MGQSTLVGDLTSGASGLVVASAATFPTNPQFRIIVDNEIMLATALAGTSFTVSRGFEGTTAVTHNGSTNPALVTQVLTAGAAAQWNSLVVAQPLINGGFTFFQRQIPSGLTSYADGSYGPDQWFVLGDSVATDIQTARVDEHATAGSNSYYSCQVKNSNVAAKHCGIAQIIESDNCMPLRGRTVRLQAKVKSSGSQTMRCAIIEWTGVPDTINFGGGVGRDPVGNWASGIYTAGSFFSNTSLTVTAVSATTATTTAYTTLTTAGVVSSACNNLLVMIWCDGTLAAGATFNVSQVGLYDGNWPRDWLPAGLTTELMRCQRYYFKSFDVDTVPVQGAGILNTVCYRSAIAGVSSAGVELRFPVPMFSTPTITYFNPSAANNKWRNNSGAADSGTPGTLIGSRKLYIQNPQVAGDGTGQQMLIHFTAEAIL